MHGPGHTNRPPLIGQMDLPPCPRSRRSHESLLRPGVAAGLGAGLTAKLEETTMSTERNIENLPEALHGPGPILDPAMGRCRRKRPEHNVFAVGRHLRPPAWGLSRKIPRSALPTDSAASEIGYGPNHQDAACATFASAG